MIPGSKTGSGLSAISPDNEGGLLTPDAFDAHNKGYEKTSDIAL